MSQQPEPDSLALPKDYQAQLPKMRSLLGPLHGVGYNEGFTDGYAAGWLECAARARELLAARQNPNTSLS
jgi:hypothetical protein